MNKKEALLCAAIAQAAYTNKCNEKDFRITAKFENKGTDTQGLFGDAYDNTFVVAFRGSEETGLADWITDAKIIQSAFPFGNNQTTGAQAHQGFIEAYQSVRESIIEAVKKTPHKRVICTGHSLGGALAVLCALDIQCNVSGKTVACYTYGAPKVGNSKFAQACQKQISQLVRFVNSSDIIPSIPPGAFEHAGELIQLGENKAASFSLTELVGKVVAKMEDHLPQNYINALREFID